MTKVTDFLIEKRNYVLGLFIILTIICLFLTTKVNINRDIAKYLPTDSEMHQGMNIMEQEFKEEESTLNVMFKGLKEEEKEEIYQQLKNDNLIDDVLYDSSSNYNKDDYTLYTLQLNKDVESKEAQDLYKKIEKDYKDYNISLSGNISDEYKTILPVWIVFLAIFCALIILIIMCDSYLEPFLFLLAIGMAVVLNKGTNIIFASISSITDGIVAILQLALSMDYSIMLMNRYREEKILEKDAVKAMKKALKDSFVSISSSSITTIVGLLALVFMSFTIGKDLGLVLAKGVLFSLLTIFTCLPALILMFDKWIIKTKKKSPNFNLEKLGNVAYKMRFGVLFIFVIVFVLSYIFKGNLGILYTAEENDKVGEIFDTNNQMALIYNNKNEEKIASYCQALKDNPNIDDVLCLATTISEALSYQDLVPKLEDLGSDVNIDDYLLKIVYYNYYNEDDNKVKLSFQEFIDFLKQDVYKNEDLDKHIDKELKNNVDKLNNFVDKKEWQKKRSYQEIANILGIEESQVTDLLTYYYSINMSDDLNLKVVDFLEFLDKDVLNSKYSSNFTKEDIAKIKKLEKFDEETLKKSLSVDDMAQLLDIDKELVSKLYVYYLSKNDFDLKLSLQEFSQLASLVLSQDAYAGLLTAQEAQKLEIMQNFSDEMTINAKLSYEAMAQLLGLPSSQVSAVYLLYYMNQAQDTEMTIMDFAQTILDLKNNTSYLDDFDGALIENILGNETLRQDETLYNPREMANILGIQDEALVIKIYALRTSSAWVMSAWDFVNFILDNNTKLNMNVDNEVLDNLKMLAFVMNSSLNDYKYTYQELTNIFGLEENKIKSIYAFKINDNCTLTVLEFVDFILNNKDEEMLKDSLDKTTINTLVSLKNVGEKIVKNEKLNSLEMSKLLGIDKDNGELLYGLYGTSKSMPEVSYREFISFLLDNVVNNDKFKDSFDQDKIKKIETLDVIMKDSLNNKKYTNDEIANLAQILSDDVDKNLIDLLYIYYGSKNEYNTEWTLTIEDFVNYLNDEILEDQKFADFIDEDMKNDIREAKTTLKDAKIKLKGDNYSRVVLNTSYELEDAKTMEFIRNLKEDLRDVSDIYLVGNSAMAYEMSQSFDNELNLITALTIIFIFVVVAVSFKSFLIPVILVILIQTAVYMTMGIFYFEEGSAYFISILIVQSILMGATIDYAILYTSYYLENRQTLGIKESTILAYNNSIHTILTSGSILTLVTLVVGALASAITAKICITVSQGTLCSTILILLLLPSLLAFLDRFIVKKKKD